MNPQFLRIPEPNGPEAELLRQAANLPKLSPHLRQQLLTTCRRQVIFGRLIRAAKTTSLVAALLLVAVVVLRYYLRPPQPSLAEQQSPYTTTTSASATPGSPSTQISAGLPGNSSANPAIHPDFQIPLPKINQSPDIISNTRSRP